jgi:hypothetical protein
VTYEVEIQYPAKEFLDFYLAHFKENEYVETTVFGVGELDQDWGVGTHKCEPSIDYLKEYTCDRFVKQMRSWKQNEFKRQFIIHIAYFEEMTGSFNEIRRTDNLRTDTLKVTITTGGFIEENKAYRSFLRKISETAISVLYPNY